MLNLTDYPLIWISVFTGAVVALFGFNWLISGTAAQLGEQEQTLARRIRLVLLLWPVFATVYALTVGLDFRTFGPMLGVPLLAGIVVMSRPPATRVLGNVPLALLVGLGVYRVAGFIFVYSHFEYDLLSRGFALNAGWGDVLTGVLAPFVALLVARSHPAAWLVVCVWTLIGVGDLILAPVSAGLYGAEELTSFPLNLIPLFLGPPFGILLHTVTLRAAWLQLR